MLVRDSVGVGFVLARVLVRVSVRSGIHISEGFIFME